MPHRTTYFFPRQFPDNHNLREFDASHPKQQLSHHERKISPAPAPATTSDSIIANKDSTFNLENDKKSFFKIAEDDNFPKFSPVSDLFTGGKHCDVTGKHQTKKQVSTFGKWFVERKGEREKSSRSLLVKPRISSTSDDDHEPLLPKPRPSPVPDQSVSRSFARQVSLPRFSSGSSYAGSLFSGTTTTVDGDFSSGVKDSLLSTLVSKKQEEEDERKESFLQRTRESYHLQLSLAKRLASEASLIELQLNLQLVGDEGCSDVEDVSYRLWVSIPPF